MQGLILIDKPEGWTSFDVVNYVRKMAARIEGKKPKNVKVGHTGTLDPFATGLLVILVGKDYTRQAASLSKVDKTYDVSLKLGYSSSTGDPEGQIDQLDHAQTISEDQFKAAAKQFEGLIGQVPPKHSAIKINGQRAYKLAREGQEVVMQARPVTINSLEVTSFNYPEATFTTSVSSGTYIRSLVEDIAKSLGTAAYTTALRRTQVGQFRIEGALPAQELNEELLYERLNTLLA